MVSFVDDEYPVSSGYAEFVPALVCAVLLRVLVDGIDAQDSTFAL
jgi:hypothetical protein